MSSSSHYTEHSFNLALPPRHQKPRARRFKPQTPKQRPTLPLQPAVYLIYLLICIILVWLEQRQAASLKWHWQLCRGRVRLLCGENWESVQPVAEGRHQRIFHAALSL